MEFLSGRLKVFLRVWHLQALLVFYETIFLRFNDEDFYVSNVWINFISQVQKKNLWKILQENYERNNRYVIYAFFFCILKNSRTDKHKHISTRDNDILR